MHISVVIGKLYYNGTTKTPRIKMNIVEMSLHIEESFNNFYIHIQN